MLKAFTVTATLLLAVAAHAADPTTAPAAALAERAIAGLRLSDADAADRLKRSTERYLVTLGEILDSRAATLKQLEDAARPNKPDGGAVADAYVVARDRFVPLKRAYVRELEWFLHPLQVDRVKDVLTDDALPRFAAMYDEMVPALTPVERAQVMVLLVEMRENAMTAIDAAAQEQWQDKYRGIINNYIARQGHDFKTLSRAWDAKHREPSTRPAR